MNTPTENIISADIAAFPRLAVLLPLCGFIFLIGTETFLISPLLPTIAQEYGAPVDHVALIVITYVLVYALAAPWFGVIADKGGRQVFIVAGALVFCLGNFISAMAPVLGMLTLGRGITGLGAALAGPAIWAYFADSTHPSVRGRIMSIGMASFSLGQVLGVPIGALVSADWSWRGSFSLIGALLAFLILPALLLYLRIRTAPDDPGQKKQSGLHGVFNVWLNPSFTLALGVTFFWAAANLGTYTYVGALLKTRYGLSVEGLGSTGIVVGVGSLLGALIGGRLSDHWRRHRWAEEGLVGFWAVLLGTAVFGVAKVHSLVSSMVCLAVWFVASGAFVTAQQTLLSHLAPMRRGALLSWNNSIMYAGTAFGVWLIGALSDREQYLGMTGFSLTILAAACAYLLSRFRNVTPEGVPS